METEELVGRMQQADGLKQAVLAARASRAEARKSSKQAGASQSAVQRALQQANARLAELQSGRGAKLAAATHATVYEFWIEVPGYSGPVRGTTARVTQHGDIQHVSNVQGQTKGGLGGGCCRRGAFRRRRRHRWLERRQEDHCED